MFDLDGTLADAAERVKTYLRDADGPKPGPVNWTAFHLASSQDVPFPHALEVLHALYDAGHDVRIWTARSDEAHQETLDWLTLHGIPQEVVGTLVMREKGDHRDDDELKPLWIAEHGRPDLVFEDRTRVVNAWRALGIPCYQVAPGDF